jgi:hypothetical protein
MIDHRGGNKRSMASNTLDTVFEKAADATDAARAFLVSERGRRLRGQIATLVIVGAPLISELPVVRRSPVARVLRTAAIGTLLIKGAEWLRDWEPQLSAVSEESGS